MCTGKKILGGSNFSTPNFAELLKQTQYILCKAEQLGVLGFVLRKLFYLLQKPKNLIISFSKKVLI